MDVKELKTVEDARKFFKGDVFATTVTGCEIEEAVPGYAKCILKLDSKHKNAIGIVMGGAIYTLADFAFAVASNMTGNPTVSLTNQISYLGTAKGDCLTAEAVMVKSGRNTCYYRVTIKDNLDRLVAESTVNGFVKS